MEKLVYLIWDRPSRDPEDLRKQFVEDLGPRIIAAGAAVSKCTWTTATPKCRR